MSMFDIDVEMPLQGDADRTQMARAALEATANLTAVTEALDPLMRVHLYQAAGRLHRGSMAAEDRSAVRRAIGFVDLVGYTTLSAEASLVELATLVREFEALAHEAVGAEGGWVVKTIGDAVMLAAEDADDLTRGAQALLGTFGPSAGVEARGGLAVGDVLSRGGDYYGPVVNAAARLADVAVPGELLATAVLGEALSPDRTQPAGRRQLKGFAAPIEVVSISDPGVSPGAARPGTPPPER